MPRLIVLASPFSVRKFFHAVSSTIKDTLLVNVGHWSIRHFPETRSIVEQVEEETNKRRLLKGQRSVSIFRYIYRWLLFLQYNGWRRLFQESGDAVAMCWNGMGGRRQLFLEAARRSGAKVLFLETSPFPGYLSIDPVGINAKNSLPRHADFYLKWMEGTNKSRHLSDKTCKESKNWEELRKKIVPRKPHRKSAVSQSRHVGSIPKNKFVFCPLQVPSDSQVLEHGDWIDDLPHMIEVLYQASRYLPEDWSLLIKEHPSAKVPNRHMILSREDERFRLANHLPTFDLVQTCRGVVTLNSSVGLQAFLYDCPVLILGHAFYGFHPLTIKALDQNHLNSLFSKSDTWGFDSSARGAFLRYLTEVYYLPVNLSERQCLSPRAVTQLKNLISKG